MTSLSIFRWRKGVTSLSIFRWGKGVTSLPVLGQNFPGGDNAALRIISISISHKSPGMLVSANLALNKWNEPMNIVSVCLISDLEAG